VQCVDGQISLHPLFRDVSSIFLFQSSALNLSPFLFVSCIQSIPSKKPTLSRRIGLRVGLDFCIICKLLLLWHSDKIKKRTQSECVHTVVMQFRMRFRKSLKTVYFVSMTANGTPNTTSPFFACSG